jgi:hypothetical protein
MTPAVFAVTESYQHLTQVIPKSEGYALSTDSFQCRMCKALLIEDWPLPFDRATGADNSIHDIVRQC